MADYIRLSLISDSRSKTDDGSEIERLYDSITATPLTEQTTIRPSSTSNAGSNQDDTTETTSKQGPPQELGKWGFGAWFGFGLDILLSTLPLLFMIVAGIAAYLHGKRQQALGTTIEEVILLLPTIFPIVFAALMGKFFRSLALYRAERGVTLGTLDRLMGCQSLFAAIERQIASRQVDVLGLVITLAWAMSPVGGQSALRLLTRTQGFADYNQTVKYLPPQGAAYNWVQSDGVAIEGWPYYAPIFMTALTTTRTQRDSTMDLWGNVKTFDIDTLVPAGSQLDEQWYPVNGSTNAQYSSLLGIPVVGISDGNSTFEMSSSYLKIDCSEVTYMPNYTSTWDGQGPSFILSWTNNETYISLEALRNNGPTLPFYLVSMLSDGTSPKKPVSTANCTLGVREVVSSVDCQSKNCQVQSMRLATSPLLPDQAKDCLTPMLEALPRVALVAGKDDYYIGSSPTEDWLADPDTSFSFVLEFANLSQIQPEILGPRLQMVINTFWPSTWGGQYLMGNLTDDLETYNPPAIFGNENVQIPLNPSQASGRRDDGEMYVCHWVYASLLFVISFILFVAGLASMILRTKTLAPDVLSCVSSFTRDNPYVGVDEASYLDGLDRTRALWGLRVVVGDVKGDSDVGHVAFAGLEMDPQRLRRGRLYD